MKLTVNEKNKILANEGKQLIKVDRFFASSKLCNNCGSKNIMLTLSDREWTCSKCNQKHDRDINASLNIRNEGMRVLGIVYYIHDAPLRTAVRACLLVSRRTKIFFL